MKKKFKLYVSFLLCFLLLPGMMIFAGGTREEVEKSKKVEKIVLKFGHVLETTHPYHKMALKFKEELEKIAPEVEVQIFPSRQLGNERELVEALQIGTVDVTTITSAVTANFVPGFMVFSLPFIFKDTDHLFKVMDSEIGDTLAIEMEKAGLIKLGYAYGGSRDLYSSVPIRNLEELKGKKIRTMENTILIDTWNALGAIATPIPWGDVYISLKQKVVDGGEGTGVSYDAMKFYDVAPYYTRINYVFSWHNFMISGITWNKLDSDLQKKVKEVAVIAQNYERKIFVEQEKALFDKLVNEHGVKLTVPEDIDEWREMVKVVYEKNADNVGGIDYINKIRDF